MRRGRLVMWTLVSASFVLVPTPGVSRQSSEAAGATGVALTIGVAEDAGKQASAASAKAKMDLAKLAGFTAVRVTEVWVKGQAAPSSTDVTALQNAAGAASLDGLHLIVSIFNNRSSNTP